MRSDLDAPSPFFVNETFPISLFENVCDGGAFTVWLALLAFVSFVGIRIWLHTKDPNGRSLTHSRFEKLFVAPFTPRNLESLVSMVYVAWFLMTITFGLTRYFERKWANETTAQQGPLNAIAWFIGCKGIDPLAATYTDVQGAEQKTCEAGPGLPFKAAEFYFSRHMTCGVLWLTMGAVQLYLAPSGWSGDDKGTRQAAHRRFGHFVAFPAFAGHIIMAATIAWRNPVNQHLVIRLNYVATILESVLLFVSGIRWVRDRSGSKEHCQRKHMVRMFFCWIQSVAGSGSVRLAQWVIFLISKFFGTETKILMDRGTCQAMALTGYPKGCVAEDPRCLVPVSSTCNMADSMHCWKPVFLNLVLMDLVIVYIEWLFLRLNTKVGTGPNHDFSDADKVTVTKFKSCCFLGTVTVVWTFFIPISSTSDTLLKYFVVGYSFYIKARVLVMYATNYVYDPKNEKGTAYYNVLLWITKCFRIPPPHTHSD